LWAAFRPFSSHLAIRFSFSTYVAVAHSPPSSTITTPFLPTCSALGIYDILV
jgi:hypothetical protein